MNINGDALTPDELNLLMFGDVLVVDEIRNIPALRLRQEKVRILGRYRLQRQIDSFERALTEAEQSIHRAKR